MSAYSQTIALTQTSTGTAFDIGAGNILSIIASGTGSKVTYNNNGAGVAEIVVDEAPSAIYTSSQMVIALTLADSSVIYLNANNIIDVIDYVSSPTNSKVYFNGDGADMKLILVNETRAAIRAAIAAIIAEASGEFATLSGANTYLGAQTFSVPNAYSNATGITAFAGGGQASATALTKEQNNVTTVATAGDSVKLPAAVAGLKITVKNSGATALDIFPASGDSIDAMAVDLAVRIQPNSVISFMAKDAIVWESNREASITLDAPTTATGALEIKASDSAGNFITTVTNASQAAARTYTIPDAGSNASFAMSEGAQTLNGLKTFGDGIAADTIAEETAGAGVTVDGALLKDNSIALADGLVSNLAVKLGVDANNGIYGVSDTQMGFAVEGVLVAGTDTNGFFADNISEKTATVGVTVDGVLCKDGGVSANSMFAGFYLTAAENTLTGAGAVSVANYKTSLDTNAGAAAITLAAGTQIGQMKKILMTVDGGDATLTLTGYTSIVFNDATDYVILLWNGAAWFVLENSGTTVNV